AALDVADGRPAFFYAHVMDAHEPYDRGRLKTGDPFERYLSELELIDAYIGRFMRVLQTKHRGRGYLLIGADHGEAFDHLSDGDHGQNYHSKNLYEEMVHIPMILWGPEIGATRIGGRASLLDIGPSVLDLFGLAPPEGVVGRSLMPVVLGQRESVGHPVAAEARKKRAFYGSFGLKVIEDQRRKTVEVYDLKSDPSESNNLYSPDNQDALKALGEARAWFERVDTADAPYRR
ncbi:MAG: arylsulfatase, partial [Myxococcota bacterium]